MAERISEPPIAWYRLSRGEFVIIGIFCLLLSVVCISLIVGERAPVDPPVRSVPLAPARIDVNRASAAELTALPGIGEKKAERIIEARSERDLRSFDDLSRAAGGIPKPALDRMRPFVTFDNDP